MSASGEFGSAGGAAGAAGATEGAVVGAAAGALACDERSEDAGRHEWERAHRGHRHVEEDRPHAPTRLLPHLAAAGLHERVVRGEKARGERIARGEIAIDRGIADDDGARHTDAFEGLTHGLDGGLVGGFGVALAHGAGRRNRGALHHMDEIAQKFLFDVDGLARSALCTHATECSKAAATAQNRVGENSVTGLGRYPRCYRRCRRKIPGLRPLSHRRI